MKKLRKSIMLTLCLAFVMSFMAGCGSTLPKVENIEGTTWSFKMEGIEYRFEKDNVVGGYYTDVSDEVPRMTGTYTWDEEKQGGTIKSDDTELEYCIPQTLVMRLGVKGFDGEEVPVFMQAKGELKKLDDLTGTEWVFPLDDSERVTVVFREGGKTKITTEYDDETMETSYTWDDKEMKGTLEIDGMKVKMSLYNEPVMEVKDGEGYSLCLEQVK